MGSENKQKSILVTGGCGFIGSNFIRHTLQKYTSWRIVNIDALTYAGNALNLAGLTGNGRYRFVHGNIKDSSLLSDLFSDDHFDAVFHFAAESHVDRSIEDPETFIDTNINAAFQLLNSSFRYWKNKGKPKKFRFINISTDEVYGALRKEGDRFTEQSPYKPSSPYSASKASFDHIVNAYYKTYGFPAIVTNCSNNFGPYQFPEKFIPLMINNILNKKDLPIYGNGTNVRDWLYVTDHCEALIEVFLKGKVGQAYNIGAGAEKQNIEIVEAICDIIDKNFNKDNDSRKLINYVDDRPGHDFRYAIDTTKIESELGWKARFNLNDALFDTVSWYIDHQNWIQSIISGEYNSWLKKNYDHR